MRESVGFSRASLVMGLMSIFVLPIFAFPSLICGLIGAATEKDRTSMYKVGIIISIVVICFLTVIFLIMNAILKELDISWGWLMTAGILYLFCLFI